MSDHVKFVPMKIHRSKLNNAPYNPRKISPKNRKKLQDNLKSVGLLQSLVWNKRTGNLVGGHQRLSIMDSLEGTNDYCIFVDMVDLDEKTEKEQNIAFNNSELAGDWDFKKLGDLMVGEGKIDNFAAGFDLGQMYQIFGGDSLADNPKAMEELSAQVEKSKRLKQEIRDKAAERDGHEFYTVAVFANDDEPMRFADMLGLPSQRYIDGRTLMSKVQSKVELTMVMSTTRCFGCHVRFGDVSAEGVTKSLSCPQCKSQRAVLGRAMS